MTVTPSPEQKQQIEQLYKAVLAAGSRITAYRQTGWEIVQTEGGLSWRVEAYMSESGWTLEQVIQELELLRAEYPGNHYNWRPIVIPIIEA